MQLRGLSPVNMEPKGKPEIKETQRPRKRRKELYGKTE
jgi:hypothetical protein